MSTRKLLLVTLFSLTGLPFLAATADAQQVQVTAASPSEAPQGTLSLDVTVSGSGFDSSAQVDFLVTGTTNSGGITVKKVKVTGSKKLIATIDVAESAVVEKFDIQVSLSGGRKGKGTSLFAVLAKANDPCLAAVDFPSFVFSTNTSQGVTYVSDRTGKCTRALKSGLPSLNRVFSYPVVDDSGNPTNRGRVVWMGPDPDAINTPDIEFHAMDFVVSGTTITPGPVYQVVNFGPATTEGGGNGGVCCGLDLSADSRDLYLPARAELRVDGYVNKVVRMRLPADLADLDSEVPPSQMTVFEHAPSPRNDMEYATDLDVNAANDYLYVNQTYGQYAGKRVLRVDLDPDLSDTGGNPEVAVILEPSWGGAPVNVGADTASPTSDLLAVVFPPTPENCRRITVMNGRTGTVLNEGTDWPGHWVSWTGGKVLTRGFRKGCRSLDTIVQVDPQSGVVTSLVNGVNPDGR